MIVPALLGLVAILLLVDKFQRRSQTQASSARPPLPPGPRPLPFFGNLLSINRDASYLTYTAWAKKYGDIIYVRILSRPLILLNSEEAAIALFEKRSQKYSDRNSNPIADLFYWEWPTTGARYGPRFRLHRRLLQQFFNTQAVLTQRPKQLQKAYELAMYLLDDPTHYADHFTTFSGAVIMEMAYGYDIKGNETFLSSMQRAADILLHATTVRVIAVCTIFPFVKALPAWLPGMGFKTHAEECRRLAIEGINAPYEWVKSQIREGTAAPSMVADAITRYHLDDDSKEPELVQAIKDSAGTLYAAAVETTNATLVTFVYLLMNHPEVQQRAQADIDNVVGHQRLPDFGDRASLPYVDAIMRETLRWHPVLPIGIPHMTSEDDVYEGHYIPQRVSVIPNVWAMSHNESKYPNPEAFMPERFLDKQGKLNDDKVPFVFGFGRRICPGRHVADASLWSAMACMLALFRFDKTEGSDQVKWTTGFSSHPLPFPCRITPRDKEMDGRKLAGLMNASRSGP